MALILKKSLPEECIPAKIPKTARDVIPIDRIYSDGIALQGNVFSKIYRFEDINYRDISEEGQEHIFREYMQKILSSFDISTKIKITISNHRRNMHKFREDTLFTDNSILANELNDIIESRITAASCTEQDRYITVSTVKKSIVEARAFFERLSSSLSNSFVSLGSSVQGLDASERLRIYHMFFHPEDTEYFNFDISAAMKKGHDFRDYISPGSFSFRGLCNHFRYGERYGRVLYFKEYSNYIKDKFLCSLLDMPKDMMVSIDYQKTPKDKAVAFAEESMSSVEYNIEKWQGRQNKKQNYAAEIPYHMQMQRKETKEFYDDLTERDLDMFSAVITIVITAGTMEELDSDTEKILSKARESSCVIEPLYFQQKEGLQTVMPFGGPARVGGEGRTLTTEALAVFMPFRTVELNQPGGIYAGTNRISGNIIRINRKTSKNGNKFILGTSGSGKSVNEKFNFVCEVMSNPDACHVIIDPDGEYGEVVKYMGGTVYNLSDTSSNHINAMGIWRDAGGDWITGKTNFAMSLIKEIVGEENMDNGYLSIVSRCCKILYNESERNNSDKDEPTLKDLRKIISEQPEAEAVKISLALELFTDGTLNTFSEQTNIDLDKNILCFDIHEMSKNLQDIAMLIIMDYISGLVAVNRRKGIETYVDIDEFYRMFLKEQTAEFFYILWKNIRKMGGYCTGLTQDVEDVLTSYTGRSMIQNSEMVVLLSQQYKNRKELQNILGLSEAQLKYITDVKPGSGLIKSGKYIVPFENDIPKNTEIYKLINTDFKKRDNV